MRRNAVLWSTLTIALYVCGSVSWLGPLSISTKAWHTSGLAFAQSSNSNQAKILGVQTCASSTCHGSSVAFTASNVLQNEYRTWNEQDPHARAFETLQNPLSQKIARNLGIESAEQSAACLGCHSGASTPVHLRADTFKLSEGVGCETCHGAAENYLESHTRSSHQDNLNAGLIALEKPLERAQLCISCHLGNTDDRKITHEIMGAGHPRLSFELNTFSSIQPAHYIADQDYSDRKGKPNPMQIWAIGQIVASEQLLNNIAAFPRAGLFPELAHMDCLGCHQSLERIDWQRNPVTQGAPGAIRFNDAHLLSSYQLSRAVLPDLSPQLLKDIRAFTQTGHLDTASKRSLNSLQRQITLVRERLLKQPISAEQGHSLLVELTESGLRASHQGYGSAEQSAMAINSAVLALNAQGSTLIDKPSMQAALDEMFVALDDPSDYQARTFVQSLKRIRSAIKL